MSNSWQFKNDKTLKLESKMLDEYDLQTFGFIDRLNLTDERCNKLIVQGCVTIEKNLFKFNKDLERNRRSLNR